MSATIVTGRPVHRSSPSAEAIAEALGGRRVGSRWLAPCVAHQDGRPSFAIDERHGKVLVHCYAGCSQEAVIDALRARGLWSREPPSSAGIELLERERDERAERKRKWLALIAAHDAAETDAYILSVALRRDPDVRDPLTRDIVRCYGDAPRRRAEIECQLDELEREDCERRNGGCHGRP